MPSHWEATVANTYSIYQRGNINILTIYNIIPILGILSHSILIIFITIIQWPDWWLLFFFTVISKATATKYWASLVTQLGKNLPEMWETWIWSLGWEEPLGKEKATHFSILAWRIPWTIVCGIAKSWTQLSDFYFHKI